MRTLAAGIAAAALALTGCGGGGSSSSSGASSTASSSSSSSGAPTKAQAAGALKCKQKAGLNAQLNPPTSKQMSYLVYVNPEQLNQVYVAFLDSAKNAHSLQQKLQQLAKLGGSGNAGAELAGKYIVIGRSPKTTSAQVNQVKSCLPL